MADSPRGETDPAQARSSPPSNDRASAPIFISAGEASGDWAGSMLVEALRKRGVTSRFRGVGGKLMREAGVELLADSSTWGVIGLLAAIPKLPMAYSARFRARAEWRKKPPAVVVLIDCGPFHMPLARIARGLAIPVLYYLPPGAWSRRSRRLSLREIADVIATPFPWSRDILAGGRARVEWVGHPAVERCRPQLSPAEAYAKYRLRPDGPILALAPGSREQETKSLVPVFVEAARLLQQELPGIQFLVPVAPNVDKHSLRDHFQAGGVSPVLLKGMDYDALQLARAGVVCSGTATLEFTCLRLPMLVVYRPSLAVTLQFRLRQLRGAGSFFGLPNIIANRQVVPELFGAGASPEAISSCVKDLISNERALSEMKEELDEVAAALGPPTASDRTAELVIELIRAHSNRKGDDRQ